MRMHPLLSHAAVFAKERSEIIQIAPTQPALKALIRDANAKIIAYYESQCDPSSSIS